MTMTTTIMMMIVMQFRGLFPQTASAFLSSCLATSSIFTIRALAAWKANLSGHGDLARGTCEGSACSRNIHCTVATVVHSRTEDAGLA